MSNKKKEKGKSKMNNKNDIQRTCVNEIELVELESTDDEETDGEKRENVVPEKKFQVIELSSDSE